MGESKNIVKGNVERHKAVLELVQALTCVGGNESEKIEVNELVFFTFSSALTIHNKKSK